MPGNVQPDLDKPGVFKDAVFEPFHVLCLLITLMIKTAEMKRTMNHHVGKMPVQDLVLLPRFFHNHLLADHHIAGISLFDARTDSNGKDRTLVVFDRLR